ncbi:HMG box family protein [Histomonas meleagridis]|uniref:HMG box family protein n=1 Tax=Histomonas meleagridis TaxID=135588 RepID=UPI00355A69B6|nr:HMG box family protein [Histomonas meleagridis]KAH0796437.1 HMG box family protein [Histomonas meleagridis]
MYDVGANSKGAWIPQQQFPQEAVDVAQQDPEADNSRRPPNAFILYSQEMRSKVQQENPTMSNIEVSKLLGKMWKEVPSNQKIAYKQKAQALQEDFKKNHPNYTYRKARRKRALNELLTKNAQVFPMAPYQIDPNLAAYQQVGGMPFYQQMIPGYPMQQNQTLMNPQVQGGQMSQQPTQVQYQQMSYPQQVGQQNSYQIGQYTMGQS